MPERMCFYVAVRNDKAIFLSKIVVFTLLSFI
jgi:hypothetical protein